MLTHRDIRLDATRHSRIEFVPMMGTPKLGISANASALAILVIGVPLLIGGGG